MELLKSIGSLLLGILKRLYYLIPSLFSDPFDITERWFNVMFQPPQWLFWLLLSLGLIIAIILTFHEVRMRGISFQKQLSRLSDEFHFEYNDTCVKSTDGRLLLGVTYLSHTKVSIETLQLVFNGVRFRPSDWSPTEIETMHTKNYTFSLSELKSVANNNAQEATFIAQIDGVEKRSKPFNLYRYL